MAVVPEFLIKRIYKKGSLKKLDDGASIVLKNVLGPGFISGFNYVKINDVIFEPKDVLLFRGLPKERRNFLNISIGKKSPNYVQYLSTYEKLLKETRTSYF